MTVKPFFLPLNGEYYLKFKDGSQDCEIRPDGHRAWNEKNIYPGRPIRLSYGYGKKDRMLRTIAAVVAGPPEQAFAGVPQWHIDAVEQIYGKRDRWLVAYISES